jgi:hypothetical protein
MIIQNKVEENQITYMACIGDQVPQLNVGFTQGEINFPTG